MRIELKINLENEVDEIMYKQILIGLAAIFSSVFAFPNPVCAQSAIEHHVWQDKRKFQAFSHTSIAITGSISLSGNPNFATTGSTMNMTFANGKSVKLSQVLAAWRPWSDIDNKKVTAEIFRFDHDPGKLLNANTLCGSVENSKHIYVVFYEDTLLGSTQLLELAIFRSQHPPFDKSSLGLCGTYNFLIN